MDRTLPNGDALTAIGGDIGRVTFLIGVAAILAVLALILLYTVAGFFGPINDVLNATVGVLSAVLAVLVFRSVGGSPIWLGLAVIGAAITVLGSWLVMTGTTGFLLAGYVSSIGFAFIGAWLLGSIGFDTFGAALPPHLARFGWAVGALMLLGLIGAGGVLLRIDSFAETPWWLWLAGIGWLGVYVLYPAWCFLVARST